MKQQMSEPKIVKIDEIAPPDFELPKLDQLKGKTIFLVDFVLDTSQFGSYAVISTKGQGNYVTSSEIVLKQLKRIARNLSQNGKQLGRDLIIEAEVEAVKAKEGEYYILTSKKRKKK